MSLLGVEGLKDQEEELEITIPAYVSRISPWAERRRIANARTSAFETIYIINSVDKKPMNKGGKFLKKLWYCVGGRV